MTGRNDYYIYSIFIQPKEIEMDYYNEMKEAVITQLDMDEKETQQILRDVARGGADGGFSGFIYHSDTVKFAEGNIKAIYGYIKQQAEDFGENPFKMIQNFSCLKDVNPTIPEIADTIHGNPDQATVNDGVDTQIMNALAWYALEEVAFNEANT